MQEREIKLTEEQFVDSVENYLKKHFNTQREVWSKCRNGRIDLVLNLPNTDIFFGIECKLPDKKCGEKMGEFLKQAVRYSGYEFEVQPNIFKKIPIAICPALSYNYFILNEVETLSEDGKTWHKDRHEQYNEHHSFNGFVGSFSIGELRKGKNDLGDFLFLSWSNKPVWSEEKKKIWDESLKKYNGIKIRGIHEKWYKLLMEKIA